MFSEKTEWLNYVIPEIKKLLDKYQDVLELEDLGFPLKWEEILNTIFC